MGNSPWSLALTEWLRAFDQGDLEIALAVVSLVGSAYAVLKSRRTASRVADPLASNRTVTALTELEGGPRHAAAALAGGKVAFELYLDGWRRLANVVLAMIDQLHAEHGQALRDVLVEGPSMIEASMDAMAAGELPDAASRNLREHLRLAADIATRARTALEREGGR